MDRSDPIISRLIEMCEYRLGRPVDKEKKKMERFIEHTRRLMAARAYELTRPQSMDQMLISAFPSVFLVYFQWHHNFRKVYPKDPPQKVAYENNQKKKRQAEDTLKNKVAYEDSQLKKRQAEDNLKNKITYEEQTRDKNIKEETARKQRDDAELSRFVIKESENKAQTKAAEDDKMRTLLQTRENTLSQ